MMTIMRSSFFLLMCVACGGSGNGNGDGGGNGDGTGSGNSQLVAGGGITGGTLSGSLHVYAIDAETGAPIVGATVHVTSDATTDATGLATFMGLSGAQTVSATASGYVAATWIGVTGADVTIPLQPSAPIPTAMVSGTLTLPSPTLGHYTLGVVLYSFLDDPSAPENSIAQPTSSNVPLNACVRTTGGSSCSWQLTARIGKQIHTAVIVDGNPQGTPSDTSDDTYTLIGYAAGSPMTLTAGQQVTGETLAAVSTMAPLSVTIPAAPGGLSSVVAIPELALGDAGRIVIPLPSITGTGGSAQVIAPTGQFAGHYEIVALATPSATAKAPFSSAFAHNISGSSATIPSWLPPPTTTYNAGTFTFAAVAGSAFYTMQLTQGTTTLWNFTILDSTTSFTLPTLHTDPLSGASGTITFALGAADVPGFSPTAFTIPNVKTMLARASGGQGTFTH